MPDINDVLNAALEVKNDRIAELERELAETREELEAALGEDHGRYLVKLQTELAEARRDTERLAALLKPVKELRALLGPDGDYAICSATEGEPSMRLVESMIVGCVLEKIDAAIDKAGGE